MSTDAKGDGFTPGPWAVLQGTPGYRQKSSVRTIEVLSACSITAVVAWPGFDESNRPYECHLANARLIAASPALYAACKAARNMIDPVEDPSDEVGRRVLGLLDAALTLATEGAKAEGGGV